MIFVDRPKCEGNASLTAVTSIGGSGTGFDIKWHPTSNYVAFGSSIASNQLKVYSFDGTTLAEVETLSCGAYGYSLDWHPDGDFLAVTNYTDLDVKVYSWNGTDTLAEVETIDRGYRTVGVSWHPDGDFLALTSFSGGTQEVTVFSWDGTDTLAEVETADLGGNARDVSWSHDGDFLAVTTFIATTELIVYSWNGTDTLASVDTYDYDGTYLRTPEWSLSDDYIFTIGGDDTKTIVALSFNGTALAEVETVSLGADNDGTNVRLSRGGNYILSTQVYTSSTSDYAWLKCYVWNESAETLTLKSSLSLNSYGLMCADISYKNNYIAYARYSDSNVVLAGTTGLRNDRRDYCIRPPWIQQTSSFSGAIWIDWVYHGNGVWVACGSAGEIATSTDGETWTQRTSGFTADTIRGGCYGNSIYVNVGSAGKLYTASDPTSTWTSRTANQGSSAIYDVSYDGTYFITGGDSSNHSYSTNGTSWTAQTSGMTNIFCAVYANSIWVVAGSAYGGDTVVGTSTDPTGAFTRRVVVSSNNGTIYGIAYGNNVWVAVGQNAASEGKLWSASDPTSTWTERTSTFGTSIILGVAFGNGKFYAVGSTGKMATSTNGTSWTAVISSFDTTGIYGIAYDGSALWVATATADKIATLVDAV